MGDARYTYARWMREFGVEVTTAELVTLESALRGQNTAESRSAVAKGHLATPGLTFEERAAVLSAAQTALDEPPTEPGSSWGLGLNTLVARLEREHATDTPTPAPRRAAAKKKDA